MRTFFIAEVVGKSANESGYMVEVFVGGQVVTYGPMHYIADPRTQNTSNGFERTGGNARTTPPVVGDTGDPRHPVVPDIFKPGDKVLIANYLYRDQFVILGKYIDMNPPPVELVQVDSDGDGIIDLIEESYTEGPQ